MSRLQPRAQAATPRAQAATPFAQAATPRAQAATPRAQAATPCAQAATLCIQAATLCIQVCLAAAEEAAEGAGGTLAVPPLVASQLTSPASHSTRSQRLSTAARLCQSRRFRALNTRTRTRTRTLNTQVRAVC